MRMEEREGARWQEEEEEPDEHGGDRAGGRQLQYRQLYGLQFLCKSGRPLRPLRLKGWLGSNLTN